MRSGEGTGGKNDNNDNSYLHITIDGIRTFPNPLATSTTTTCHYLSP